MNPPALHPPQSPAPFAPSPAMYSVPVIAYLAPVFFLFEIIQLVAAERLVGIKQIERGTDPRKHGPREMMAAGWTMALLAYWLWMGMMLVPGFGRIYVVMLIVVSLLGYGLRKNTALKWTLVILTFEGAIRIGMLVALMGRMWRAHHMH
jgi:hypothetical protein